MNRIVRFNFTLVFLLLSSSAAFAEYRAYELEVFDRIVNTSRKVITSFSPSDFIQVNGGPQRIGIIIRASWICYGDTSLNKKVCPMPKAINPRFQEGERVQIVKKTFDRSVAWCDRKQFFPSGTAEQCLWGALYRAGESVHPLL